MIKIIIFLTTVIITAFTSTDYEQLRMDETKADIIKEQNEKIVIEKEHHIIEEQFESIEETIKEDKKEEEKKVDKSNKKKYSANRKSSRTKSNTTSSNSKNNKKSDSNDCNDELEVKSESINSKMESDNSKEEKEVIKSNTSKITKYDGIPDPKHIDYVYHHGKIEYSSMSKCLASAKEISFKDTVDILNTICVDVVDGNGKVLGEYLYINCESGNCNKYK